MKKICLLICMLLIASCLYGCAENNTAMQPDTAKSNDSPGMNADDVSQIPKQTNDAEINSDSSMTLGQSNALKKARQYIESSAFSYQGLVEQLEFEGYEHADAVYGAENCGADWQEQANKKAKQYLDSSAFSYNGLIEQLEFEGFSTEAAKKAVDGCGADWFNQAAKKAKQYLSSSAFSRDGLIEQLEFEGFSYEQAVYGVESVGY